MRSNAWCDTTVSYCKPDVNTTIKLDSNLNELLKQCSFGYDINGNTTISYNKPPEDDKKEETIMKEIKNQQIVDLYFERKVRELKKKLDEDIKVTETADPHKSFVEYLRSEFNTYVENNVDLNGKFKFDVSLPCTPECSKAIEKLRNLSMDEVDKVHEMKHEVLTMLFGCDTYEQEMAVLRSYGIVSDKTVKMM